MPSWILVCGKTGGEVINKGSTMYATPCGYLGMTDTEVNRQFIARDSYTLNNLFVRVTANTVTASTTVRSRVNTADGNQSVSIPAGATGTFQDTSNSDALVDGDLFNYQAVAGATGTTITFTVMSFCLQTISNNTPILGGKSGASISANLTTFVPIGGDQTSHGTESRSQYTFRVAATLSNLRSNITYNGVTAASTIRSRVNGANGNQSLSIPASTTGVYEDTTNSDSIASGDNVNLQVVTGATGNSLIAQYYQLKSTSAGRQVMAAKPAPLPVSYNTTAYGAIEDTCTLTATTESEAQVITEIAFTAQNYFVRVVDNSVNNSTTVALRQNGADTALSVSIPASTTGAFEDSDSVSIAVDDLLDNKVATGGTSGTIRISIIGFELAQPAAPPPAAPKGGSIAAKLVGAGLI